uniref:lipoprotein insertase outer membrane protein LolB n=1 Tax=Escherichia coli TaxID=562 RepID=UPI002FCB3158
SVSGSLNWQQQGPYFQANMTTFVGISIFELETDARGATVKADGETHKAQSASALLDYLSGWSLPIEEMPLWLKGVASTESFNHQWDAQGRLTSFTLKDSQERGWQVSYIEFFPDALALPKHIQLNSKTDGSRIKLVVRKWQL